MTGNRRISLLTSLSLMIVSALTVAACGGGGGANASSATAARSSGSSPTVRVENSSLGEILVNTQGRTLYLFKAESPSVSACDGPGDVNGQGVTAFGAPWYAVSPAGSQVTTAPSGSGSGASSPGGFGY